MSKPVAGDIVSVTFEEPLVGNIRGEYVSDINGAGARLIGQYGAEVDIERGAIADIVVLEPQIQPGDVVVAGGGVLIANHHWVDGNGGWFIWVTNNDCDGGECVQLPEDAVWIRRGGKLVIGHD